MKCQECQKETFLPFKCPHCQGNFCTEHRLPETHNCPQMEQACMPKQETPPITTQKQEPYEFTITYVPTAQAKQKIHFSTKEIIHLTIAALLVIGVGLSFIGLPTILYNADQIDYPLLALFTALFTASFFTHEIAHKITAQKHGLWAEFRLTIMGAILTLFSIVSPIFKIISPGAVMVAGPATKQNMGKISIAGPATNLALSTAFLATALLAPQYSIIFILGAAFNAWIALFNLIPIGILDGYKIFTWSKLTWAMAFTASLALTIVSYRFLM